MNRCYLITVLFSSFFISKTESCEFSDQYNWTLVDWPPSWSVKFGEIVYQINLCHPLQYSSGPGKDNCSTSAICQFENGTATSLVSFPFTSDLVNKFDSTHIIEFRGTECVKSNNSYHRVLISFICNEHLGSPELYMKTDCDTYFYWKTSAVCTPPVTRKEVPCYVLDANNQKRDLTSLVKTEGGYLAITGTPAIEFYINVCSDIAPDNETKGCPQGSSACRKIGSEYLDFGQPVSGISTSGSDLKIKYSTENAHIPAGCDAAPQTTIIFKCPPRGRVHSPRVVSDENCQYEIEWETEYACPQDILKGNFKTCQFTREQHQVELDLSPLRKESGFYAVPFTKNNKNGTFLLNVCGGIGIDTKCGKSKWSSNAVCLNDTDGISSVVGVTKNADLKYADGKITLSYFSNTDCKEGFPKSTVIEFQCNPTAANNEIGLPEFVEGKGCTYYFNWKSKYACLKHPLAQHCYVDDGNIHIDLGLLIRKIDGEPWEVVNSLSNDNSTFYLNVCGDVPKINGTAKCDAGTSVCKIDSTDKAVSYGRYVTPPTYDRKFQTVEMKYKNGDSCNNKRYQTHITFICKPGILDSPPVLKAIIEEDCLLEMEWYTAAACPQATKKGDNCKVVDDDLGFTIDLSPLKSSTYYEAKTDKYIFRLNVCGPVSGSKCDQATGKSQNAAACQEEIGQSGEFWKLGEPNSELLYTDGMIKLVYKLGTPYVNGKPRIAILTFLCDDKIGTGYPVFIEEFQETYIFHWYTAYACPSVSPVECVVTDSKSHKQYDLSRLTKSADEGDWMISEQRNGKMNIFYINVCHPLNRLQEFCGAKSSSCVMEINSNSSISKPSFFNLGQVISPPEIYSDGHLSLLYSSGSPCISFGENTTYSTRINFVCQKEQDKIQLLGVVGNCEYTFLWTTEAACPIQDVKSTNVCKVVDPVTGYTLDFESLKQKDSYNVTSGSRHFQLNICGTASGCLLSDNSVTDASVCEINENGKLSKVLGVNKGYSLELSEDKTITLIYEGVSNETAGVTSKVYIELQCSKGMQNKIDFVQQDGSSSYFFEMKTPLACVPEHIDCLFIDSQHKEYDLTPLIKWGQTNWEVADIRIGNNDIRYHINFCKPLNPTRNYKCPVGMIGSCQTSSKRPSEPGLNLGYFKEKPVITKEGVITLHYTDGSPCRDGQFNYSTVINLFCSKRQMAPIFLSETPECQYIFMMQTPAACPLKAITNSNCSIRDPVYGYEFNLNPLRQEVEQYHVEHGEYDYILNVCGPITGAPGSCINSSACQTKPSDPNFVISMGMPSTKLEYYEGVIRLKYETGDGNCHGKYNRSTIITFVCDHSVDKTSGPSFVEEKNDCTYVFEWPTSLVCLPTEIRECSISDDVNTYDLSSLSLSDSNYDIAMDGEDKVFVINVCRTVIPVKDVQCYQNSAACIIDFHKPDNQRTKSIGQVNSPYIENGVLKLRYSLGDNCEFPSGEADPRKLQTVIEFGCDHKALSSTPKFIGNENCTYYFMWSTAAACPVNVVQPSTDDCVAVNPATGFKFNLTSLRKETFYEVNSTDPNHKFLLNVCDAVRGSTCASDVGSCQKETNDARRWNAGKYNSKLYFQQGFLYLNYSDGDVCHKIYQRSTVIEFQCGIGIGEPIFLNESSDCTYFFLWKTALACEDTVHCVVRNGSTKYDLTTLKLSNGYHIATDETGDSNYYYLNVCGPLYNPHEIGCPPNVGICKVGANGSVSLGEPSPPFIDFEGRVTVIYPYGSFCRTFQRNKARIIFLCDSAANLGDPYLIDYDEKECLYLFHWKTNLVCSQSDDVIDQITVNCSYVDTNRGINFDLSPLHQNNSSYEVAGKMGKFTLNICGSVIPAKQDCTSAGVCLRGMADEENYGSANHALFAYNDQLLTLTYSQGGSCPMSETGKRSSRIIFLCDLNAGYGKPILYKQSACLAIFKWLTSLVCRKQLPECALVSNGNYYDLRLLSSISHNWNVSDDKGNVYWLNICRGTKSDKLCENAAVCRKDMNGVTVSLGEVQSQEMVVHSTGEIIMTYSHGSDSVCLENGKYTMSEIKFTCGDTLGKPEFISGSDSDCMFKFSWRTTIACAEVRKVVIPEEDGMIYDSRLNVKMDLSPLLNETFHVEGVYQSESYVYIINLEKGVKNIITREECQFASVCQTKPGRFYRDIGSLATRKFYLKGTEMQLELTSLGRKCGKNNKKNVTTIINFVCVSTAGVGKPTFFYESGNCDYLFEWETELICPKHFINPELAPQVSDKVTIDPIDHGSSSYMAQVITGVIFSILLVALIIFVVSKEERRNMVKSKVLNVYRSIHLPRFCYRKSDGESMLLSTAVVTTYHDDSDVEILT